MTNTIYVASWVAGDQVQDNTIAVIDGSRCSAKRASHCTRLAQLTNVGPAPTWLTFDPATRTLYVTNGLTPDYEENNTITVLDTRTCNARNTSGCGQAPAATVTVPGPLYNNDTGNLSSMALDATTHTLYVGDAHDGPASMINTATCNAMNTAGCTQTPATIVNGDQITLDSSTHSVYVGNANGEAASVFDGATCNSTDQSGCNQATTFALPYGPLLSAVDSATHTLYVPMASGTDTLGFVGLVDVSACNATVRSGCGVGSPHLVNVGSLPFQVLIDPTTKTAYVESEESASISILNTATCNAQNQSGCPQVAPALATGINPTINIEINPNTHTLYSQSEDSNTLWVFDTHKCNAMHTQGCTDFAPITIVGAAPIGGVISAQTGTLYVSNQLEDTVSIVDTRICNRRNLSGCSQSWPKINVGVGPRFEAINNATNTLYVANIDDSFAPGWISVINAATCNGQNTSNCAELAQIPVGAFPQQMVIDEATNTIYVENQRDNNVSVVDLAHCNANDVSACNQAWPTAAVGASPQGLGLSSSRRTLYVANTNDDTVSVISTVHCAGSDTSGCTPVATVPVGAAPRSVGIVDPTDSVFVGNRDDLTVSVFDGSTCNGNDTSGCPQTAPPAFVVGAFPDTAGNMGTNINGRALVFDSSKHTLYIPVPGDSDLAKVNTIQCRAGHVDNCHVKIMKQRAGGLPLTVALDDAFRAKSRNPYF